MPIITKYLIKVTTVALKAKITIIIFKDESMKNPNTNIKL